MSKIKINRESIKTPWSSVGYLTYKRTYSRRLEEDSLNSDTEEFHDTIERVIKACQEQLNCNFTSEEEERLYYYHKTLKGVVAGRFLWQLGTSTVDKLGLASLQNCAFCVIDEPIRPFTWAMDMLMLGSGVGYNIQREFVYKLPPVKDEFKIPVRQDNASADFIVPDTRAGWVELLKKTLEGAFSPDIESGFTFSTQLIRGKGAPIKGFGGVSSGPEDLCWGIDEISKVIQGREGKQLRPIDCLDIMNIIGAVVVAGNVRRSAQIAIGDSDDLQYLNAKNWSTGTIPNWRANSNNSVVCNDFKTLPEEFWNTYKGGSEPYGIINLKLARAVGRAGDTRYKDKKVQGFNPCQPDFATVLTPDGLKQFKDVDVGSKIWSKQGWTNIINKWSTGVKDVFSYRTTGGEFIGTFNHKVDTKCGKCEIDIADKILTISGENMNIQYRPSAVIDGVFFGDGYYKHRERNKSYPILTIGKNDYDYFDSEEIKPYLKTLFGRDESREDWFIETSISKNEKKYTHSLEIPTRILYGDKSYLAGFLRGLYTADGSVIVQNGNSCRVTYKTVSSNMARDVQLALSTLGIRSYITTNKPQMVEFENGTYLCKKSYDVNITKDRKTFSEIIGFVQKYKMNKLNNHIGTIYKGDTYTKKTDKIYLGRYEVFDITVDNDSHTYWTGGLSVSNCAEQGLETKETCALAENFLSNIESKEELFDVLKLLYRVVKHSLRLPCHNKDTEEVVWRNMRMGLGMTGYLQATEEQRSWLPDAYEMLRAYDVEYSAKMGWPVSIKLTTAKPSGTLSLLPGVTPGVHPGYAQYMIRRIRIASNHSLVDTCKKFGYHVEFAKKFDGTDDHGTMVVEFPFAYPEGTVLAKDVSAIAQLEWVKRLQTDWSDNSVSCTVYYRSEELPEIREYLSKNFNKNFKTLSFLLHSEHGFVQAPFEEITKDHYDKLVSKTKLIDHIDSVLDFDESNECNTGVCPIR